MYLFNTSCQNWTALKTFLASLTTATVFTTEERARLVALYAKFASSTVFAAADTHYRPADNGVIIGAVKKMLTRKTNSTD